MKLVRKTREAGGAEKRPRAVEQRADPGRLLSARVIPVGDGYGGGGAGSRVALAPLLPSLFLSPSLSTD